MENLQVWQQNQRSHQLLNQKPRKNQSDPNKVCFFFPAKDDLTFSLKSRACSLRHTFAVRRSAGFVSKDADVACYSLETFVCTT
jgi:hypothetical protein